MANITGWAVKTAYAAVTFTAADLNSLASGGGALSTSVVSNGTALDQFATVSFIVTVGGTTIGSPLALYVLPLNQSGSTYGDGYASSTTTQPVSTYLVATCLPKVGVTTGNTIEGTFLPFQIPPNDLKLALGNSLGIALGSTANLTLKIQTFNVNLNA